MSRGLSEAKTCKFENVVFKVLCQKRIKAKEFIPTIAKTSARKFWK
jgi:hypothetical protein